ncbi:G domain-containing protein [Mycena venus]|uniref:G domain-containing protein n=1 Tax=Mycena venus TaxID=2733690 RepID=A0A8H7D3S4_9AGAR|nr:G domain-containing protein [Mycena venus]
MEHRTLPPTTVDILHECPRFRVLVVGKSGVGKSSLINYAFGVNKANVSHEEHGVSDINTEITSPQNSLFVLHDSQGFEPGETANFEKVEEFLQSRGASVPLKERVHAVWLCVQVPFAGGRVFETGDERFFDLIARTGVPVVVVFTQLDQLLNRMEEYLTDEEMEMPEEEINQLCSERANAEFQKLCVGPLERIDHTLRYAVTSGLGQDSKSPDQPALRKLIEITQDLVSHDVQGIVWVVSAMAQRASARAKIDASIEVGMKRYWQGLAASVNFSNLTLERCTATIHLDITESWNFNDPDDLLNGQYFRDQLKILAQLVVPELSSLTSWFAELDQIQTLIGVGAAIAAAAAPAFAVIGLSAMFINWIAAIYQRTPGVLRFLMGYIVDLTLVMDQLFILVPMKPPRRVTREHIDMALESYKNADAAVVHREIRKYATQASFAQICQSNKAQDKVLEIIKQHCAD